MEKIVNLGRYIFAVAVMEFGAQHLLWANHLSKDGTVPVIPWVPGGPMVGYVAGVLLLAMGVGIALNLYARAAAVSLGVMFLICEIGLQLPLSIAHPLDIGIRTTAFEVLAICGSAWMLAGILPAQSGMGRWAKPLRLLADSGQYLFAVSMVVFGISHFLVFAFVAGLVPGWIPFGGAFWTTLTGVGMIATGLCLAGVGLMTWPWFERLARLSTGMLGLMFLLWFVVLHAPRVLAAPGWHNPDEWSSAFIALGMCGGWWVATALVAKQAGAVKTLN